MSWSFDPLRNLNPEDIQVAVVGPGSQDGYVCPGCGGTQFGALNHSHPKDPFPSTYIYLCDGRDDMGRPCGTTYIFPPIVHARRRKRLEGWGFEVMPDTRPSWPPCTCTGAVTEIHSTDCPRGERIRDEIKSLFAYREVLV